MNGVFNTGLNFWQFVGLLILAVLSIIAIRITLNLNEFLSRRDKNNLVKLKNSCPHFSITVLQGKEFEVRSLFYKPYGFEYVCRQCGLKTVLDMEQHERQANYYVKNPDELIKDQKKLTKLAKKIGMVSK